MAEKKGGVVFDAEGVRGDVEGAAPARRRRGARAPPGRTPARTAFGRAGGARGRDALLPRQEGDTLIVPVLEEVLVVEKRLVVKEELRITRRRTEEHRPQRVTLLSEEVSVERAGPAEGAGAAGEDGVGPPL